MSFEKGIYGYNTILKLRDEADVNNEKFRKSLEDDIKDDNLGFIFSTDMPSDSDEEDNNDKKYHLILKENHKKIQILMKYDLNH